MLKLIGYFYLSVSYVIIATSNYLIATVTFYAISKFKFFCKFGVLSCGIRAQGSNTRPWWSPTSFYETVIWIIMLMYFVLNVIQQRNCFRSLTTGMDMLEEYAEEESQFTEPENLPRDPILEDLTTNSSKLLQPVKYLKY